MFPLFESASPLFDCILIRGQEGAIRCRQQLANRSPRKRCALVELYVVLMRRYIRCSKPREKRPTHSRNVPAATCGYEANALRAESLTHSLPRPSDKAQSERRRVHRPNTQNVGRALLIKKNGSIPLTHRGYELSHSFKSVNIQHKGR